MNLTRPRWEPPVVVQVLGQTNAAVWSAVVLPLFVAWIGVVSASCEGGVVKKRFQAPIEIVHWDETGAGVSDADRLLRSAKVSEARAVLEAAVAMSPGSAARQYNAGVICEIADDPDAARRYYIEALRLDPTHRFAVVALARQR